MSTDGPTPPVPARWWLPSDPDRVVSGSYEVDERGAPLATLHDHVLLRLRLFGGGAPIPLLHGEAMGQAVTLVDAQTVSGQMPMRGQLSEFKLKAAYALEGDVMLLQDELTFDVAEVWLRDLRSWADWTSWRDEGDEHFGVFPHLKHQGAQARVMTVPGATLTIRDAGSWTQNDGEWTLTTACKLSLQLDEPHSVQDLDYEWLRPWQLLLATATARPSRIERLLMWNSRLQIEADPDGPSPAAPRLWLRHAGIRPEPGVLSTLHCRHLLSDFDLDSQIATFLSLTSQHRYALERYEDAVHEQSRGVETHFLNSVQALEAFDTGLHDDDPEPWQAAAEQLIGQTLTAPEYNSQQRRAARGGVLRAHVPSLSERLRRLDVESGNATSQLVGNGWADHVAVLRNAVAHGRSGRELRGAANAMRVATVLSRHLFDRCWLHALGFDRDRSEAMLSRRASYRSEVEGLLEHAPLLEQAATTLKAAAIPRQ